MRKKIMTIFMMMLSLLMGTINVAYASNDMKDKVTTIVVSDNRYRDQAPAPVGYFEVEGVDGKNHIAFCGWHEKKSPQKGWKMSTVDIYTAENKKNEDLRKVLWYGYDGPGNIGANYWETALAASVALGHMDTDDTGETEGPVGKTFLNKVKKLDAPPSEYEVYCVRNLEETEYKHQCLVYAIYEPMGRLNLTKTSNDQNVSGDNECYSLANAVYGVFADEDCLELIGELITDNDGKSKEIELNPGTYFVKELEAPQGYLLDEEVYSVEVNAGTTKELKVTDTPCVIEIEELLIKYDKELGLQEEGNKAQGAASLEGAEYKFDLYGGYYKQIDDLKGKEPIKSWTLKTNLEGKIGFEETVQMPLGTLVVKEEQPSEGYCLNEEVQMVHLKAQEEGSFKVLKSAEDIIKGNVKILKYELDENEEKIPMKDVTFILTSKTNGKEFRVVTNEMGEASTEVVGGLPYDTYVVREENTPEGYTPCETFEVCISEEEQILIFEIENKKEIAPEEPVDKPTVENPKEPIKNEPVRTGDTNKSMLFVLSAGFAVLVLVMCLKRKKIL